jgi:hypothetical protein
MRYLASNLESRGVRRVVLFSIFLCLQTVAFSQVNHDDESLLGEFAGQVTGHITGTDSSSGGPSSLSQCRWYDGDQYQCEASGCTYDWGRGVCYGGEVSPLPPHQPPHLDRCSQFDFNQFPCEDAGCYFDRRSGSCYGGGPQPVPAPGYRILCVAVGFGHEGHRGGHSGIGHTRFSAEQAAMGDCLRYHGQCRVQRCRSH